MVVRFDDDDGYVFPLQTIYILNKSFSGAYLA